jgi:hypothetical protein
MKKSSSNASVREQKAQALDTFVKGELARTRALDDAKRAKLRALRLERDEQAARAVGPSSETKSKRKTIHLPKAS